MGAITDKLIVTGDVSTLERDIILLNDRSLGARTRAAEAIGRNIRNGAIQRKPIIVVPGNTVGETNNHWHDKFSFGPEYPTMAAFLAWLHFLETVGSINHDSYGAAREMKRAGELFQIGTTCGFELRLDFSGIRYRGLDLGKVRLNNPDAIGINYAVSHGISIRYAQEVADFLAPINIARNLRNVQMVGGLNDILGNKGIRSIDFNSEVYDISEARYGGSITERHILAALSQRVLEHTDKSTIVKYLMQDLGIEKIPDTVRKRLEAFESEHILYDLLGLFKTSFLPQFYIQPNSDECIPVEKWVDFTLKVEGIPAYAWLGDVKGSQTGDKLDEQYEDQHMPRLMPALVGIGILAIAYMLPRNTEEQRAMIREYCDAYSRMQINGVDRNSSRQDVNCPILGEPRFANLNASAWALVGHEHEVNNGREGLFVSDYTLPVLNERIERYAQIGRESVQRTR